jgi:hypothetical protein
MDSLDRCTTIVGEILKILVMVSARFDDKDRKEQLTCS